MVKRIYMDAINHVKVPDDEIVDRGGTKGGEKRGSYKIHETPPNKKAWSKKEKQDYKGLIDASPLKSDLAKSILAKTIIEARRACSYFDKIAHRTGDQDRAFAAARKDLLRSLMALQVLDFDDPDDGELL